MKLPNAGKFSAIRYCWIVEPANSSIFPNSCPLLLVKYRWYASDRLLLALVHDLSVDLGRLDVLMSEELGDRVEVGA